MVLLGASGHSGGYAVIRMSFGKLARLARRAMQLTKIEQNHPAVVAVGASVDTVAATFLTAHDRLRAARTAESKEIHESTVAMNALAREYDTVRAVVVIHAPHEQLGSVASRFNTPDDLLAAAEVLEDVLESYAGADWATKVRESFSAALDTATREWVEGVTARSDLQKAQAEQREAAMALSARLVEFRRVVRSAFGSTSREYHSIKSITGRPGEEDGLEDEDGLVAGELETDMGGTPVNPAGGHASQPAGDQGGQPTEPAAADTPQPAGPAGEFSGGVAPAGQPNNS